MFPLLDLLQLFHSSFITLGGVLTIVFLSAEEAMRYNLFLCGLKNIYCIWGR